MTQLIQRHSQHTDKSHSDYVQGSNSHAMLSKKLSELTIELKQLKGEDLHGLGIDDLLKLEKLVEGGLHRVGKTRNERLLGEMRKLKTRESQLMEENARLKQPLELQKFCKRSAFEQGNSAESNTNCHGSDTSLKLGLP